MSEAIRPDELTPYWALRNELFRASSYKVPTYLLSSPMKRTDNIDVFHEGRQFSGITETEHAMACVTINASPHVGPTIPTDKLLFEARRVFGIQSTLPNMENCPPYVAPQVVVWWEAKSEKLRGVDFHTLHDMDPQQRNEFIHLITHQTVMATRLIKNLRNSAVIWGSWGTGTLNERIKTGLSRGGPSNKLGHCHVSHMEEAYRDLLPMAKTTSIRDAVAFYSPWVMLLTDQFRHAINNFLASSMYEEVSGLPRRTIKKTMSRKSAFKDAVDFYDGFSITFGEELPYETLLNILIAIAGQSEKLYQDCLSIHDDYYKSIFFGGSTTDVTESAWTKLDQRGLPPESISPIIHFISTIKPTYIQLLNYKSNGTPSESLDKWLQRYEIMRQRMQRSNGNESLVSSFVYDSYKGTDQIREIETTWPQHASFWYLIEKMNLNGDELRVKSLQLFPLIGTGKAGPERTLGGLINRS